MKGPCTALRTVQHQRHDSNQFLCALRVRDGDRAKITRDKDNQTVG